MSTTHLEDYNLTLKSLDLLRIFLVALETLAQALSLESLGSLDSPEKFLLVLGKLLLEVIIGRSFTLRHCRGIAAKIVISTAVMMEEVKKWSSR